MKRLKERDAEVDSLSAWVGEIADSLAKVQGDSRQFEVVTKIAIPGAHPNRRRFGGFSDWHEANHFAVTSRLKRRQFKIRAQGE
jgi:hypothetical protein